MRGFSSSSVFSSSFLQCFIVFIVKVINMLVKLCQSIFWGYGEWDCFPDFFFSLLVVVVFWFSYVDFVSWYFVGSAYQNKSFMLEPFRYFKYIIISWTDDYWLLLFLFLSLFSFPCLIALANIANTILSNSGDCGQPCCSWF
jgi:hypothetical protein